MAENGLVGSYTHSMDAKGRVFFPAKYREELGAPIVITVSTDKCLCAYSPAEWSAFVESLRSLPKTKVKDIERVFCGRAVSVIPDSQGRILLNESLIEYAGLTNSVTFIGCADRVELWATEKKPLESITEQLNDGILEMMKELGL